MTREHGILILIVLAVVIVVVTLNLMFPQLRKRPSYRDSDDNEIGPQTFFVVLFNAIVNGVLSNKTKDD